MLLSDSGLMLMCRRDWNVLLDLISADSDSTSVCVCVASVGVCVAYVGVLAASVCVCAAVCVCVVAPVLCVCVRCCMCLCCVAPVLCASLFPVRPLCVCRLVIYSAGISLGFVERSIKSAFLGWKEADAFLFGFG